MSFNTYLLLSITFLLYFIEYSGSAVPSIPSNSEKGICKGRTVLTNNTGYITDHVGSGNYTRGIICEWLIDVSTASSITLQILPNSIFAGSIFVWEGDDNSVTPDWEYLGYTPDDVLIPGRIQVDEGSILYYFTEFPFNNADTATGVVKGNSLRIPSNKVLLQFRTAYLSDFDGFYPNFEAFPGFSMLYWTDDNPAPAGLSLLCSGSSKYSTAKGGYFTDGWGAIYHSLGNFGRTAQTCNWNVTVTADFGFTIKSFQPVPGTQLKITTPNATYTFNESVITSSNNVSLNFKTVPPATSNYTDLYYFWYNSYIHLTAGEWIAIDYVVPLSESTTVNDLITNSSGIQKTSGFLVELYPEIPINQRCYSNPTTIKYNFPSTNEHSCLWITDAIGGAYTTPTLINLLPLSCSWQISLSILDPIVLFIKDMNLGSGSRDSIRISTVLDSGPFDMVIGDDPINLPPLLSFPKQLYTTQWTITYNINSGGGHGFILLFTTKGGISECLNATTPEATSLDTIGYTATFNLGSEEHYYLLQPPDQQEITSWWEFDYTHFFDLTNRIVTYAQKSYVLSSYTDLPDADNSLLLIRERSHGLNLPPAAIELFYFFPDLLQEDYAPSITRIDTYSESNVTFTVLDMNTRNYFQAIRKNDYNVDYTFLTFPVSLNFLKDNSRVHIRSIAVCHDDVLILSYLDGTTGVDHYSIAALKSQNSSSAPEIYELDRYVIERSKIGSKYGYLLAVSPSCAWVVTTHSPQTIKIFLKYYFLNQRNDPVIAYTWWNFYPFDADVFIKDIAIDETDSYLFTCKLDYGTVFIYQLSIDSPITTDWTDPNMYNQYLSELSNTNYVYRNEFEVISSYCNEDTMVAGDVYELGLDFKVFLVGTPRNNPATVIIHIANNASFVDFVKAINYTGPVPPIEVEPEDYDFVIEHDTDERFGMDVEFGFEDGILTEIIVLGTRLYIFEMNRIMKEMLDFNFTDPNPTKGVKISDLDVSFFPNRFAFGEDWSPFDLGQQMNTVQNQETLTVLFHHTSGSPLEFRNASRSVVRSVPGKQSAIVLTDETVTKNFLSQETIWSDAYLYYEDSCPPGSFNPSFGFSPCLLCPAGTYQNNSNSLSCIQCANGTYCPLGAVDPRSIVTTRNTIQLPVYATGQSQTVDILVWTAMFRDVLWLTIPLYFCWAILILCGLFVLIDPCFRGRCDAPPGETYSSSKKDVKSCLIFFDPAKFTYYDPVAADFRDKGSVQNSLLTWATIICLLLAFIFILYYYNQYAQYDGTTDYILNNQRTSSLKTYFTTSDDETALLNYLRSRGLLLELFISGYSREDCYSLCNEGVSQQPPQSSGCYISNSDVMCHDLDPTNILKCNVDSASGTCKVSWGLPKAIDLQPISTYSFFLKNTYIQELKIRIFLQAENDPQIPGIDLSENTAIINSAETTDTLQLASTNLLLFGITRQYELTYVLQTSEQVVTGADGTPGNDWKMTAVFQPLQRQIDTSTDDQKYFGTSDSNRITIQLSKPNYYIGNSEGRIYQSGGLFLTLVNVLAGIVGIFQLFGALIGKCTSLSRHTWNGGWTKERDGTGNKVKSPRYDRVSYNPYDVDSLMDALVKNDLQSRLNEGRGASRRMEEE